MSTEANVRSIQALESFRAHMIVFLTKAKRSVDAASDEVKRTQHWVQQEQRVHWEGQIRRRSRALEQAEAELMTARLSSLRDSQTAQEAAVRKAKLALEEAQVKLRNVKRWERDFETTFGGHLKRLESVRHFLDHDLPKATHFLYQVQMILDSYTQMPGVLGELAKRPENVKPETTNEPAP